MSRRWLALVFVLFCLPLFIGLRSLDLETDEAIYSFAVDRILETGDWLQPKSSPSETAVFLEKPPLKFWIVAAPIRAGLLPHDEFGLRFWDAVFGGAAFLYVFAIGRRLAGPVCGGVAVLLLFVHWPLLLYHGLRTNNMEGPLFLAYCGGVFHFIGWARSTARSRQHAVAAGLYFVLGFLTKFVAVLFLPLVLGLSALMFRQTRTKLVWEWRTWAGVAILSVLLIAPWFIYASLIFGNLVWHTMLAEHVYARFTVALNQEHIHPWNYYLLSMTEWFERADVQWFVPAGLVLLLVQSIRRRWFEGTVVVLWAILPLTLISLGSSKLYHYAYPFLPPLTLAAGYLAAMAMMLGPVLLRKFLVAVEDRMARLKPGLYAPGAFRGLRTVATASVWLAACVAVGALLFGSVKLGVGNSVLFKSSGIVRPIMVILVAGLVTGRSARVATLAVALTIAWLMPIPMYEHTFHELNAEKHPLRDASLCIRRVEAQLPPGHAAGLYVDTDSSMWHPIYYYFRRIQPWTRQETPSPDMLDRVLHDPAMLRPSLVQEARYRDYLAGPEGGRLKQGGSPPMIGLFEAAPSAGPVSRLQFGGATGCARLAAQPMDLVEAGARGSQPDVRHPWERARFSTAARLIARHVRLMPGDAVLDVGCGDTFVVEQLARAYPDVQCHAVDSAFTGTLLETYRARLTVPNVSLFASLDDVPLRRPASLVLLMDVLEHVADDAELLQDLMRRPLFDSQTCMFITVPAYAWLFSSHDRLLGHYRRYSTRTLQSLLDRMNLSPVETGGLFASLLPLRALQMITERLAPTSADAATDLTTWNGSETTTRLLTAALSADVRLTRALARIGIRVPGLSNFVVCRKSA